MVPLPGANPEAPYCMSQAVSVPPAVQERSAEFAVIFDTVKLEGGGQVAATP